MPTIDILSAKAHRSRLAAFVCPVARPHRRLGGLAGRVHIPADFDAPLPDEMLGRFALR